MGRSSCIEVGLTLPSIAEAEPAPPEESRSQLCLGCLVQKVKLMAMVLPRQASSEDPLPPVVCEPQKLLCSTAPKGFGRCEL